MARVIVTGGAGFIGSHLVDALVEKRHRVTVIDDLSVGHRRQVHRRASFHQLDVRSPRLAPVLLRARPDVVFHLAAQKNLRTSVDQPGFDAEVNIVGSLRVIEACRLGQVKQFVFASTAGVYADTTRLPLRESSRIRPPSPYGLAKSTVEQYLEHFAREGKVRTLALRYANVYGPRQDPDGEAGVIAVFFRRLLDRRPLFINGHGRQTRDYIYVDDVVRANLRVFRAGRMTGAINISTGTETSVNELAATMLRVADRAVPIRHRSAVSGETKRSALDWHRAQRMLGWKPNTSLSQGLRNTWASIARPS